VIEFADEKGRRTRIAILGSRPRPATGSRPPNSTRRSRAMGVNMKMIQQMQTRLEKMQRELADTVVEGSAGGGVVTARVTGAREFRGISIDPSAVDPEDVEVLEDLITVAIQDAMNRANTLAEEKMGAVTGGLSIPGLM
jgi:nucleoid-associated protein EbfC